MLSDQFETSRNRVLRPARFCNPVDKNGEGIPDPTAHLMCYQAIAKDAGNLNTRIVTVENQFGTEELAITRREKLCLPARKDAIPSPTTLDHFRCYRARRLRNAPAAPHPQVTLADQFETKTTDVLQPILVCNPTSKNGETVHDPQCHLTCYRILDSQGQTPFTPKDAMIEDQFADLDVHAIRGTCRRVSLLCVPSLKMP
jgi:hypothetical protein